MFRTCRRATPQSHGRKSVVLGLLCWASQAVELHLVFKKVQLIPRDFVVWMTLPLYLEKNFQRKFPGVRLHVGYRLPEDEYSTSVTCPLESKVTTPLSPVKQQWRPFHGVDWRGNLPGGPNLGGRAPRPKKRRREQPNCEPFDFIGSF
jgi:hypothetical protein